MQIDKRDILLFLLSSFYEGAMTKNWSLWMKQPDHHDKVGTEGQFNGESGRNIQTMINDFNNAACMFEI